jgi:protein-tyrosine phosphatase
MGLPTVSFGLAACTGTPADPVAAKVAQRRQVDMSSHRAQGADDVRLGPGDLLVAMEIPQARWLRPLTRLGPQITLLGLWCRPRRPHLEDPFGLSEEYFDICFSCIDSAIDAIARQMAKAKLRAHAGWIPA